MAELTALERLQPALLDRLTDDDPGNEEDTREHRVLTKGRFRKAVLRDLAWLFNATSMTAGQELAGVPLVASSVVNFGLPALSGQTASTLDIVNLERAITQAIVKFEPRIDASSLRVQALASEEQLDEHNVVNIEIRGALWAQPIPLELLLRTQVDLETGAVEIRDLVSRNY